MDNPSSLEIYIPVEAEVKSIPLKSLPRSVLRRLGLSSSDARKRGDLPEGIWICPAVVRRKGQKGASHAGNDENVSSMLGTEFWATRDPIQMSFVASSRAAYKVLKNTVPGIPTSDTSQLPQGSAPQTNQDALVIYRGRIYLSKKPRRSQDQQKRHEPQPVSQSSSPSTSDLSQKRQKEVPQNNNRPKKRTATSKISHGKNKRSDAHEGSDVSAVKAVHPVAQPADSVQSNARREHASAAAARETPNPTYKEAESTEQSNEKDGDVQMDGGESAQSSSSHQATRTESPGAATSSTSLQTGFDFNELEQEERIARMKARLSMTEANLP